MMQSRMAFTTEANKIFLIMGCVRNQKTTNLYDMMGIKSSSIFGFGLTANLAMSFSFFSGQFASILPLTIIRYFPTSPIRATFPTLHDITTSAAAIFMPITLTPTNRTYTFMCFLEFTGMFSMQFFMFLIGFPLAPSIMETYKASFCSRTNQSTAIKATIIDSYKVFTPSILSHTHITILIYLLNNCKHRQPPSRSRGKNG